MSNMRWEVKRDSHVGAVRFVAVLNEQVGRRRVIEVNRMEGFRTVKEAWEAIAERQAEIPSSRLD